jgi:hypothetical protein
MGNFSRETFDRLKHYVGVRLQQGVPIVDADWNELEDIRKYELRAFIRWFIGDGVAEGNDGFAIFAVGDSNDFGIRGGDGTAEGAGHILVDGWDAVNESDMQYTGQALFNNNDLATEWGVDPIPPLTTPAANRTDLVYIDVWEREVDSTEDPDHLVNPAIGIETAVRLKREWAVRVVEGSTTLPTPAEGHSFSTLAHLSRTGGSANIGAGDIADQRQTGINLATLEANITGLESEIATARGSRANLGDRINQSLNANGDIRQNTVGNTQVPNGGLTENKIVFNGSGHSHAGGANGTVINTNAIANDAINADKIDFVVVASGGLSNIAPGQNRDQVVDATYDGRILYPVISSITTEGIANVTIQIAYNQVGSGQGSKFQAVVRVTNLPQSEGSTANASVTYTVYAIAEGPNIVIGPIISNPDIVLNPGISVVDRRG